MRKQVAAVKRLADKRKSIFSFSNGRYYTSVARGIQASMPCLIHFRTSRKPQFRGHAITWSRVIRVRVRWPKRKAFYRPEHWIIYDMEMAETRPAAAARCIAHELFHVLAHDPTSPDRRVDERRRVIYSDQEEIDADFFSLLLLKNRQYMRTRKAPLKPDQLIALLKGEAGEPAHLTLDDIRATMPALSWRAARNT